MEPNDEVHLQAFNLNYFNINNTAEYDALILGLELAVQKEVQKLLMRGDSLLIIQHVLGNFEVKEQQLVVSKSRF